MDPITGIIAAAGLGMQVYSAFNQQNIGKQQAFLASEETQISEQITGEQMQENQLRQQAMNTLANRQKIQFARDAQMRGAQGLAAATNQGAQFSSSEEGGQAQERTAGAFNILGVQQQQDIGNQLFGIQNLITGQQGQMSQLQGAINSLQGASAVYAGISNIGGALSGAAGPLGNILGNFYGNNQDLTSPLPGSSPLGQGGIGHA